MTRLTDEEVETLRTLTVSGVAVTCRNCEGDSYLCECVQAAVRHLLAEREEMRREVERVKRRDKAADKVLAHAALDAAERNGYEQELFALRDGVRGWKAMHESAEKSLREIAKHIGAPEIESEHVAGMVREVVQQKGVAEFEAKEAIDERDTARARVETLEAALRMLSDLDCYSRQQSHPVARMKGRLRHWHKTGQCVSCAARAALEGKGFV